MAGRTSTTHYVPGMSEQQAEQAARLEAPVLAATLIGIPVVVLLALDLDGASGVATNVLNWGVWLIYVAEIVIMLRLSPSKWEWVRRNPLDIIVVVLTPPLLPEALDALYSVRLLRVIDLLPLLGRRVTFNAFRYAILVTFLTALGGGIAFVELEEQQKLDPFEGVYWAVTTITTTGYGDISPETVAGRILTMGVMIMGPVIIGLVASGVGTVVAAQIQRDLAETHAARAAKSHKGEHPDAIEEIDDELEGFTVAERRIIEQLDILEDRIHHLEGGGQPPPEPPDAEGGGLTGMLTPSEDVPSDIAPPPELPRFGDPPPPDGDGGDDDKPEPA